MKRNKTISIDVDIVTEGEKLASRLGISFSTLVQNLIANKLLDGLHIEHLADKHMEDKGLPRDLSLIFKSGFVEGFASTDFSMVE